MGTAARNTDLPGPLAEEAGRRWSDYCDAAREQEIPPIDDPGTVPVLRRVFGLSEFVSRGCIRRPDLPRDLLRSGDLHRSYPEGEFFRRVGDALSGITEESALADALREVRRREMVRIAFRDLSGAAGLEETMADLSAFADAAVDGALTPLYEQECRKRGVPRSREGEPQRLVVMGMGKLGARELNFSSDVDLIFAFPRSGETDGDRNLTNEAFFLRLARSLMKVLGEKRPSGQVFRVDMNLRPFGENGPLVMSFDAMESYYQIEGREWERYAWIKARPVAGDTDAGDRLLSRLNPFIYRRYLDFGVFESLRDMKRRIALEVKRRDLLDDIKLGPGGIREIEFFGQVFQLIRGGVSRPLQERRILRVLSILAREGYIETGVRRELDAAYRFLRNVEHRLQESADGQTHRLPSDDMGRLRLAAGMGFHRPEAFEEALGQHRSAVTRHFATLLEGGGEADGTRDDDPAEGWENLWAAPLDDPSGRAAIRDRLAAGGFRKPEEAMGLLEEHRLDPSTRRLSPDGRERLDRLMPRVLSEASRSRSPDETLRGILDLLRTVQRRTCYVSLLLENPAALAHLARFATLSPWILSLLSRHPVLLDELLDPRTLYRPPDRAALAEDLGQRMAGLPTEDLESQMDVLRVFKQVNTLRVAAADITSALPLMRVSDHLSDLAEVVLDRVLDISWDHLVEKHGRPVCRTEGRTCDRGFVAIAYGKLGGLELGYGSDLDLVFLHAGTPEETQGGRSPTDSGFFYSRLGQRVIHLLTAHTSAGTLYETDMRLRPSGSAGVLVCHVDGFGGYQAEEAWTWEKQALIRARPVCGDPGLAERFREIRRQVLTQKRDPEQLREEVLRMRERMRRELAKPGDGEFDLKQGPGGMVDVEFLVQYLVLRHAHARPELVRWTDNVRQIATLAGAGVIDDVTAYLLRKAYLTYRIVGHRMSLRNRPAKVPDIWFRPLRTAVGRAWMHHLEAGPEGSEKR